MRDPRTSPLYTNRTELVHLPVGTLKENSNAWGVYDLVGSTPQWCSDYYSDIAYRRPVYPRVDPLGPSLEEAERTGYSKSEIPKRVERGGRWCPVYGGNLLLALLNNNFVPRAYTRKGRPEGHHRQFGRVDGDTGFRWVVERTTDE